ncbi:MAG: hypothetical protein HON90_15035 [Halobacteriovoraceae bacterium]|jgi:hypothetical protein|nr:hypothetical protein [Halobacteriovoraceae bacterium]
MQSRLIKVKMSGSNDFYIFTGAVVSVSSIAEDSYKTKITFSDGSEVKLTEPLQSVANNLNTGDDLK